MEDLFANQNQIMGAINQLLVNFKKDGSDRKTAPYIKKKLDTLSAYWREFQSNHSNLLEYEDQSHSYFTENWYDRTFQFYNEAYSFIQKYITLEPRKESLIKPATPLARTIDQPNQKSPLPEGSGRQTPGSIQETKTFEFPSVSGISHPPLMRSNGNNSKLDEMLRKQRSNFKAFAHILSNIDLNLITEKWECEDILKTVNSRWSTIDDLHWKIDSESYEDNLEYDEAFTSYEQKYNQVKKDINSKMWSVHHREKFTPKMDIPIFNGNYHQWVSFKDLYCEAIHNNNSLSNAQKMQYLKSKLRGEPEKIIQHLHISSQNYQAAWDLLHHRYNNSKLIFGSQINILLNLPTSQQQTSGHIKKIFDSTNESLNAIKNLGVDISNWDPLIVHILCQKLDSETHKDYMESLKNPRDLPQLSEFLEFLENKFTSLESSRRKQDISKVSQLESSSHQKKPNYFKSFTSNQIHFNQVVAKNIQTSCPLCKNEHHGIFHCNSFLKLQPIERRNAVAKLKLCVNCLYDHYGKNCISDKRCRECQGRHNTLIHDAYMKQPTTEQRKSSNHVSQSDITETLLATASVKVQAADGTFIKLRALIDQGSQISIITERAAQMLQLPRQKCKGVIFGVGAKENNSKGVINIICSSAYTDYQFTTDVVIMKNLVNNLPNKTFIKPDWPYLESLQLADPDFNISRPVDLLLGADVYASIILSGIITSDQSQPVAQQTRLGWILCGNVIKSYQCNIVINNVDEIQRFWEIEDIPDDHNMNQEDIQCLEYFKNSTTRRSDGKYIVRLPLISGAEEKLGESKSKAVAQLKQLEKRFIKHPHIEQLYKSFINEYEELGHMQLTSSNPTPCVYLPHHCVLREASATTALRVVFNASSKTSSGQSLNDVMHRGPNLQRDLLSLIIKWRQYQYAYTADIEKMYRQILLHDDDQKYQRIMWRDSPTQNIQEYQLSTVTYGTKAAPFLAMRVLKQLAEDEGHKYQDSPAAKVLQEQFYMDDLISGSHDISSAKQLQSDLINLLKSGGFNLRKWSANTKSLLEGVSTARSNHQPYDFKFEESSKTLGLQWHPQSDEFTFDFKIDSSPSKVTKRILLSDISKLFDPLGWLSPVTTKFKLLFQQVWSHSMEWDDELPLQIKEEWIKLRQDINNISKIRIPRWLKSNKDDVMELHGFCDASINAYACVIYCRIIKRNHEQNSIVLVAAKSRLVPPKKSTTLPRLELCASELLSKLMHNVKTCLSSDKNNIKIFGWCDSTAVLGWLQGDPTRWKTFVANRVIKVTNVLPAKCWRYVKSQDNPADCASRGITMEQLHQHSLWWHGPVWLTTFEDKYDKESPIYITEQEVKKQKQVNFIKSTHDDNVIGELLSKHSNFSRVTRILAYILRMKYKNKQNFLTTEELQIAKLKIIKYSQGIEFDEDIQHLQGQRKASSKSKILSLNPFIDTEGLLRVGGRLRHASISKDMMNPLIIPHESRLTHLLIDQAHKMTYHGGARVTLAWLRQQYWILGGNRAIKKRLRQCVTCRRYNPIKQHQLMGDLPEARSNPSRPFYHTGVDYTGYVDVKSSKGRGIKTFKGYIAVFVCMVTKAVHLELVSDLTSSAFLAALRRMAARRGTPGHIYSDNGTNFVGANKIINKEFIDLRSVISDEILGEISEMNIMWHFNAPSWPSAGGLWEAAVKSLKYHLRRVIGDQKLTFEEYTTLLTQLEACLNSRPLCPITEDPEDINYLTPSHFLSSGPVLSIVETERDERTRWQLTQKIFGDIWKRWRSEYLAQLSARSKWQQTKDNINLDSIVIIHDANLPAGKWALGRIVELHPGKDGLVRVVTIKTKSGNIKRPVTKLTVLPVNPEANNQENHKTNQISSESSIKMSTQRSSGSKLSNLILFTLLLICTLTQIAAGAYNITPFKDTQSLYFDKTSNMRLIRDEWKMIVYYDMDPYWQGSTLLKQYITHLENICSKLQERQQCDVILLQLRHGCTELHYYDQLLLGQHSVAGTRVRRGLINGLGNVAHALFGVLDNDFAEQYAKDIDLIRNHQQHLVKLWKNQTSVIEAQYNFLKRLDNAIDQQHKIFNQYMNKLEQQNFVIKEEVERLKAINKFTLSCIIVNNIFMNLKQIQNTLLDTVTDVYHGKFDIHLLSPDQLKDELSIISGHLSKEVSLPIDDIHSGLSKLYHLLRVKVKITSQYLLFEIKIPLLTRESYDIYRVIPIPKLVNNNSISIIPISEYMAINIQRDSYLPMTETDVQMCLHSDATTKLCELRSPVHHMQNDQSLCITNNSSDSCQTITDSCKNIWNALNTVNTYLFYCCKECNIRFMCDGQVTTEQVHKAGILSIGKDCVLKGDSFMIYSHRRQSNEMHTQPDLVAIDIPPINNMINLTVPISINKGNQSEPGERAMSLKEIERKIKDMKNENLDSDLTQISYHDVHHYVLIYVILFGACCSAVAALVWRRLRARRQRRAAPAASASAALEPLPRPAPRLSLHDIASACASEVNSVSGNNQLSMQMQSARKQNRATSPVFTSVRMSDINN